MKNIIFLLSFLTASSNAQYFGDLSAEKSFEQSSLYFKNHFLNTYGIASFANVSPYFIPDDPFLRLHVNPANDIGPRNYFYLDLRGDYKNKDIPGYNSNNDMRLFAPGHYYDPRWNTMTREDPQPLFSLGGLIHPFHGRLEKMWVGGTYQLINKTEEFYVVPSWIYLAEKGFDSFGNAVPSQSIPIIDRFATKNEMSTDAHLFSTFAGWPVTPRLSIGVSLSGVLHKRNGEYLNSSQDLSNAISLWESFQQQKRTNNYNHWDGNGGVVYQINDSTCAGVKLGYLQGRAKQNYSITDSSRYNYYENATNYSNSLTNNLTRQSWVHDGRMWYVGLNYEKKMDKLSLSASYRYALTDIDQTNSSTIRDTSNYISQYRYDTTTYHYTAVNGVSDRRHGNGATKRYEHEFSLRGVFTISPKGRIITGIYLRQDHSRSTSNEPVEARRYSQYGYNSNSGYNSLQENKRLEWSHNTRLRQIKIPVIALYEISDKWTSTVGLNHVINRWRFDEETIAYYTTRMSNNNDVIQSKSNFGERFVDKNKNQSDSFMDVFAGLDVKLSKNFSINTLLNPDFKDDFKIRQWWLGFKVNY